MTKDNNTAHAYQLKYRGVKYAFIIALSNDKPINILIYRGAIMPRVGYLFKEGNLLYFKGNAEGARAKLLDHKTEADSEALIDLAILSLSFGVPVTELVNTLKEQRYTVTKDFSKLLVKGLRKHYEV